MTAKEQAVLDIKDELKKENKSFIAFKENLNPVIRNLVRQKLQEQGRATPCHIPSHPNSRLEARCLFAKGEVEYTNYRKYYGKE